MARTSTPKRSRRTATPPVIRFCPDTETLQAIDTVRRISGPVISISSVIRAGLRLLDEKAQIGTPQSEAAILRLLLDASVPRASGPRDPARRSSSSPCSRKWRRRR